MNDIFEYATRNKIRYKTSMGNITVEDLWDLPLTSARGESLDKIAKGVNKELKAEEEESFVVTSTNKNKRLLEVQLEILKHIIAYKIGLQETQRNRSAIAEERRRLTEILAQKEDEQLMSQSADDIRKQLANLNAVA